MNISLFSLKGGVSKTSIALNLALELNYPYIENDRYSGVSDLLNKYQHSKRAFLINSDEEYISLLSNAIYDFSTCVDPRSKVILAKSDLVIIPTLHSYQDIKLTVQCISTLRKLGQENILIVINRINTRYKRTQGSYTWYDDYKKTENSILASLKDKNIQFIGIRENKGWSKATELGKSIFTLASSQNLMAKNYQGAVEDLTSLLAIVKQYER